MSDVHDMTYYGKCMVGGIFACGITHAIVCPLDIVKCRRQVSTHLLDSFFHLINLCRVVQVDPNFASSLGAGFKRISAEEGMVGFTLVSSLPSFYVPRLLAQ